MKKEMICISCPLGCRLDVEYDERNILRVSGNECKRGIAYAEKEIFHPERIVTTTVKIRNAAIELLPVKTSKSVPRALVFDIVRLASSVTVDPPVKSGEVIIPNVLNTGADIVSSRAISR